MALLAWCFWNRQADREADMYKVGRYVGRLVGGSRWAGSMPLYIRFHANSCFPHFAMWTALRWLGPELGVLHVIPETSQELDCRLDNASIKVVLLKDGTKLFPDGKNISQSGQIFTLHNFRRHDEGVYLCRVEPPAEHPQDKKEYNIEVDPSKWTSSGLVDFIVTFSFSSSKSIFSRPSKEKCISEVGNIIIFHLSKL